MDLFEAHTIEHLLASFGGVLETLIQKPETNLAEFALTPGLAEQSQKSRTPPDRITVTATFTAEPLAEPLEFWLRELELPAQVQFAPYNQLFQQLLDPASLLSRQYARPERRAGENGRLGDRPRKRWRGRFGFRAENRADARRFDFRLAVGRGTKHDAISALHLSLFKNTRSRSAAGGFLRAHAPENRQRTGLRHERPFDFPRTIGRPVSGG